MIFFNNPWVVGIGGGILSGLIVFFITRFFLTRAENKEYLQKVNSVNREIINSIKPGLSESIIPHYEVVESLINSTSDKYGVDKEDVYDLENIVDDLVKGVMDSNFISAKDKTSFCDQILQLKRDKYTNLESDIKDGKSSKFKSSLSLLEYKERQIKSMSLTLGFISSGLVVFLTLFIELDPSVDLLLNLKLIPIFVIVATIILSLLMILMKSLPNIFNDADESDSGKKKKGKDSVETELLNFEKSEN